MAEKLYSECRSDADKIDWLDNLAKAVTQEQAELSKRGIDAQVYVQALDGDGEAPTASLSEGWQQAGIRQLDALQDHLQALAKEVTKARRAKLAATWRKAGADVKIADGAFEGDVIKRRMFRAGRVRPARRSTEPASA